VKKNRQIILHPFLFGIYPVIALLAYNIEEIQAQAALRSLLIAFLGTVVLFTLLKLWLRDWHKAAFVSSLFLGLFFSYGHIYNFLETTPILGITFGRHRLLGPLWLGLFILGFWWAVRKAGDLQQVSRYLNIIAVLLLVFPLSQLGLFEIRTLSVSSQEQTAKAANTQLHLPTDYPAPDIYYIILDGYSRDDMLKKNYNLDNTPFLNELKGMGFFIASCGHSNYAQTELSLASSLNSNYLDALDKRYTSGNTSRVGLPELIKHSATRQALESLGYSTVAFETGFDATQLEDASLYLSGSKDWGVNDFENLLIRTTAGRIFSEGVAFLNLKPDWEARDEAHRQQVLFTLSELKKMPSVPGPKFVFAHLVIPHWPHVFGPNGERVHEHPDSVTGYRDQVLFINKQIAPILDKIIKESKSPPIIIVQGDHGSVIESPQRRMSILNAYYLPYGGDQKLYEQISPVNSFRVVLDYYFGDNLSLLEDTSYYSIYAEPYSYQIVTNERPGCQVNP
jgi:hypothetical protein